MPLTRFAGASMGLKLLRTRRELPAMIVALAVGVGLTVAVYSLIRAVLLTPLPYIRPADLVQVWTESAAPATCRVLSETDQTALADAPSPFRAMASYHTTRQNLLRDPATTPVSLAGAVVSANLFDVLGIQPLAGRTLEAGDAFLTSTPPIVVSERLIRSGAVSGTVGELLRLDGATYRLVGVLPDAFWFPDRQTAYWIPLPALVPESRSNAAAAVSRSFSVIARLADGVTRAAAEANANARLKIRPTPNATQTVKVETYSTLLSAPVRPTLFVLQAASGLVLLLVCLNVGWLFAARARRLLPTFATMRALGASVSQVLTAQLISALCVAAVAAPCAVLTAWVLLRFGLTLESGVFSRTAVPAISGHVAVVAAIVTVLASLCSCLPGALMVARWRGTLSDVSRTATHGLRWERPAMVVQVALVFAAAAQGALVALVLLSLSRTNVGLHKTDFVVVPLTSRAGASVDARTQVDRYKTLLDRLERRGVRAAAASIFPLTQSDSTRTFERRRSRDHQRAMVRTRIVTPSYFDVTGLVPTAGRRLTEADAGSRHMVVTDAFAAAVLQGRHAVGQRAGLESEWTIVGVAPAVRQAAVNEALQPEAYVLYDDFVASQPSAGNELRRVFILAETPASTATTLEIVGQETAAHLPDMTLGTPSHIRDLVNLSLGVNRLVAAGSVIFASVALLLAALGLSAMVSHGLQRRRREIGIRMALGASSRRITLDAIRPVAIVYGVGLCGGMMVFLAASGAVRSVIAPPPGVGYPPLPLVGGVAAATLLAALAAACYRPVKTAAGTDPALSLRME